MSERHIEPGEERAQGESFGAWLRQQRELREIGLNEIADRTKISVRYLRAMEQDRFEVLPGPIFVRGFLREYARYVGLDPDEAVNYYLATRQEDDGEEEELERGTEEESRGLMPVLVGVLAVAVVSLFVFSYLDRHRDRSTEPLPPFSPPALSEPAQEAPPAAASEARPETSGPSSEPAATAARNENGMVVTVDFSEDCWVAVVIDGTERLEQRFVQGESLQLSALESVEFLTLGNAGGVSIEVNGRPFPFEARPGQVLHDLRIDLERVRALAAGES